MCFSFSVADLYKNSLFDSLFTVREVSDLKSTGLEQRLRPVKTLFPPKTGKIVSITVLRQKLLGEKMEMGNLASKKMEPVK